MQLRTGRWKGPQPCLGSDAIGGPVGLSRFRSPWPTRACCRHRDCRGGGVAGNNPPTERSGGPAELSAKCRRGGGVGCRLPPAAMAASAILGCDGVSEGCRFSAGPGVDERGLRRARPRRLGKTKEHRSARTDSSRGAQAREVRLAAGETTLGMKRTARRTRASLVRRTDPRRIDQAGQASRSIGSNQSR